MLPQSFFSSADSSFPPFPFTPSTSRLVSCRLPTRPSTDSMASASSAPVSVDKAIEELGANGQHSSSSNSTLTLTLHTYSPQHADDSRNYYALLIVVPVRSICDACVGAYFSGLIGWLDQQIAATPPHQSLAPLLAKSHKYVEDSLGSIADTINTCVSQLNTYVDGQATEVEQVTQRLHSIHSRLSEMDAITGQQFQRQLSVPRQMPRKRLKLRVLTGEDLPALARPKPKYTHMKIDLSYLEHVGVSGSMDFVPNSMVRQTSTLNVPGAGNINNPPTPSSAAPAAPSAPSSVSSSSSSSTAGVQPPSPASVSSFEFSAPPLLSGARGMSFAGNDPSSGPPSLSSFRAGSSGAFPPAPTPPSPSPPPQTPSPSSSSSLNAPPIPPHRGSFTGNTGSIAPVSPARSAPAPPTPPPHRPSLSGGALMPPPPQPPQRNAGPPPSAPPMVSC